MSMSPLLQPVIGRGNRRVLQGLVVLMLGLSIATASSQDGVAARDAEPSGVEALPGVGIDDDAPELTVAAEQAIRRGLKYLLDTQNPDGSWTGTKAARPIGGTSLALMAFMVDGHFPGFGRYGEALDRGKLYLLTKGEEADNRAVGAAYEHAFYTLALAELWGMTADVEDNARIQKALGQAVDVILRGQSPLGGWRYSFRPDRGQDTSVTGTVFVGLASARQAGMMIPDAAIERMVDYLRDQVWDQHTGGFGYGVGPQGITHSCTAAGAYAAQLAGQRDAEWVKAAIRHLQRAPGMFETKSHRFFYYAHYYAVTAMVLAGDEHYAKWYPQIRDALIKLQNPDGSWGSGDSPHTTPMAIIILGTPHRYLPIYQR